MAANVVNLRLARKQKRRVDKDKVAEQNRISFGRTKDEKTLTDRLNKKAKSDLDQKKIED